MTTLALALVLTSAVIHASWNLLAKRAGGGAVFVWLACAVGLVVYTPLAVYVLIAQRPALGPEHIGFMAGSAVLHTAYFVTLQRGYRVGDLSLVYPLARGTGPMLSTLAAIAFLGERPTPLALIGAGLVVACVFVFSGGVAFSSRDTRSAVAFGLLTGVLIAAYTLWDKRAVGALLIPPLVFDWGNNLFRTALLTPNALRRWNTVRNVWHANRLEAIGVGVLSPLAYILVLTALAFTDVHYIAPAREVSILFATVMGTRLLSEQGGLRRMLAAGGMVLGVIALAVG